PLCPTFSPRVFGSASYGSQFGAVPGNPCWISEGASRPMKAGAENEKTSLASDLQELKTQLTTTKEALAQQQLRNSREAEHCQASEAGPHGSGASLSFQERADCHEAVEKAQLAAQREREVAAQLEVDLRVARRIALECQSRLAQAQEELLGFSEELAGLYHHICTCHSITPQRVVLDYYREGCRGQSTLRRRSSRKLEASSGGDRSPSSGPGSPCGLEPLNVANLMGVLREQLGHLQVAVSLAHRQNPTGHSAELERDKEALVEEVLKLKSLLSTKREQIATLRTVLKANKQVWGGGWLQRELVLSRGQWAVFSSLVEKMSTCRPVWELCFVVSAY
ncbi:protein bicaudal D homolog 2-like, partial [Sphaerodactylus townsendi]|uniref:protein bicaudal D homolog 2-like n=1 Tax=Sphaerodactylus townsendi TaxID=933632 RepID=UPI002025DA5E